MNINVHASLSCIPRIVFIDIESVCIQQQSAPGEEAVEGEHTDARTRVCALRFLKIDHNLLRINCQTILRNPS